MCERGLRGRGMPDDGDLARPESPRRCTLPITALRVTPPSSAAIWLADNPSAHNFLSSSTRSSFQLISFSSPADYFSLTLYRGNARGRILSPHRTARAGIRFNTLNE
jgi:hypothetical protein